MSNIVKKIESGLLFDASRSMYPSKLVGHVGGETVFKEEGNHVFGIVSSGEIEIQNPDSGIFRLRAGMYFSSPGETKIMGSGSAAAFVRQGYRGLFAIGGPVE